LVTISRHIKFGVHIEFGDGQFVLLQSGLDNAGMVLNVTSRDAHVPDIERHIRTIKERARATLATLPFKALPPWLVIEMVYSSVFWLNAFPP